MRCSGGGREGPVALVGLAAVNQDGVQNVGLGVRLTCLGSRPVCGENLICFLEFIGGFHKVLIGRWFKPLGLL